MKLIQRTLAIAVLSASTLACAAPLFVGSWQLYSGPFYADPDLPPLVTGQQAAAALFGGLASDYVISTAGSAVADINYQAWYDQFGFGQGMFAQDYLQDTKKLGYYDAWFDASAMVRDHLYLGDGTDPYVNYAFRVSDAAGDVPEPMSVALLGGGLLGMALVRRKRKTRQ